MTVGGDEAKEGRGYMAGRRLTRAAVPRPQPTQGEVLGCASCILVYHKERERIACVRFRVTVHALHCVPIVCTTHTHTHARARASSSRDWWNDGWRRKNNELQQRWTISGLSPPLFPSSDPTHLEATSNSKVIRNATVSRDTLVRRT